ncbi:hypothetical protein MA16_Dca027383 [Dendrobium catenatum]|uniref:Uncharacterized protein n=1 Tax=Dendrobium catenatum TaxID=906689 RepID=A0A2I0VRR6_9ASPA|nr:hypothetical protein MA16_Dca027383 [Dendrobium catenatum]
MSMEGRRPLSAGVAQDNVRSSGAHFTHQGPSHGSPPAFGDDKVGFDHKANLWFKSSVPLKINEGALLIPKKVTEYVGMGKSILVDSFEKIPLKANLVSEIHSKSESTIIINEQGADKMLVKWFDIVEENISADQLQNLKYKIDGEIAEEQ